ncbi:hypothetical protein NDJ00_24020 [Vibrio parahaemolyticus]|uniref:hypothetical protein n=1 Tax=Vibrio parahaemolyticus TaxID=670 RepID=UPI0006BEC472|nr:hypothetical protein [Vibrio parahaemolyticus]KOY41199.1 hypothetical protein ACX10_02515 [Vibrio parahaemolyticus]MCS0117250.1 hypothetical protein [Vibrio parahaemolyticus]
MQYLRNLFEFLSSRVFIIISFISVLVAMSGYQLIIHTMKQQQYVDYRFVTEVYVTGFEECEHELSLNDKSIGERCVRIYDHIISSKKRNKLVASIDISERPVILGTTIYLDPMYFDIDNAVKNTGIIYDILIHDFTIPYEVVYGTDEVNQEKYDSLIEAYTGKVEAIQILKSEAISLTKENYSRAMDLLKWSVFMTLLTLLSCLINSIWGRKES